MGVDCGGFTAPLTLATSVLASAYCADNSPSSLDRVIPASQDDRNRRSLDALSLGVSESTYDHCSKAWWELLRGKDNVLLKN